MLRSSLALGIVVNALGIRMELTAKARGGGYTGRRREGERLNLLVNIEMEERERTSLALQRRRSARHLPARTNIIDGGG